MSEKIPKFFKKYILSQIRSDGDGTVPGDTVTGCFFNLIEANKYLLTISLRGRALVSSVKSANIMIDE